MDGRVLGERRVDGGGRGGPSARSRRVQGYGRPLDLLPTRDGRGLVQGAGMHLGGHLGSREAAVDTAGARGLNLGLGGGVWRRWLVNAR